LPIITKPVTTYGLSDAAHIRAVDLVHSGGKMQFRVTRRADDAETRWPDLALTLNMPGVHNVRNALATIAVGMEVGVPDDAIVRALASFRGVGRRFQRYGDIALERGESFTLIDDYAHHPAEMAPTIEAVRAAFPGRRLVLAFQPHRYTRTRDCFEDFVRVLSSVDVLLLTEVYAAGESPIVAADGRALVRAIRVAGKVEPIFVEAVADLPSAIREIVRAADVVVTMGAGSIGTVPAALSGAETVTN
jgi:UDP-N-acetylmuramate--alanine ligase